MRRWLILAAGAFVLVVAALVIVARQIQPRVHAEVIRGLSTHLDSQVTLEGLEVSLFPRLTISGRGLVVRYQGRTDIPPLVVVGSFVGHMNWGGAMERHVSDVRLDGLEISIPPRRRADMPKMSGGDDTEGESQGGAKSTFRVDRLLSTNARLSILPKQENKDPRVFDIFSLDMREVSFVGPATFEASLTNPIPFGRIETRGSFGPWAKDEPSATPLDGQFTFDADLGTIRGIAGAMTSTGTFGGTVDRISTSGQTTTPDFRIPKLKAAALPLATTFDALVDGTNGDVRLDTVDVRLGGSHFVAKGDIVGTKGIKGKRVLLEVTSNAARMEDVLSLTVRTVPPAVTGHLTLQTSFDLPQGEADVVDKLRLAGSMAIKSGRFTGDTVQDKVDELSRRGQGRPKDTTIDSVVSNLSTRFQMADGVITLRGLTYAVRGAAIAMDGTYALERGTLDFAGVARLQASASDTQTGFKHFLLKPFDFLLRKDGSGTRLAIKVSGTVDHPKFGLDLGKTLKGK